MPLFTREAILKDIKKWNECVTFCDEHIPLQTNILTRATMMQLREDAMRFIMQDSNRLRQLEHEEE